MVVLNVEVLSMSGEPIHSGEVDSGDLPSEMMLKLEELTGVPSEYQRLLLDGQILERTLSFEKQGMLSELVFQFVAMFPEPKQLDVWNILGVSKPQGGANHSDSVVHLQYLLRCRADLDCSPSNDVPQDIPGVFPLLEAASLGNESYVRALLDARADPSRTFKVGFEGCELQGAFPLLVAAFGGHEGCVRALLEARADPSQSIAEQGPVRKPVNHHVSLTPLIASRVLQKLPLEGKSDPAVFHRREPVCEEARLPLVAAAKFGHEGCIRALVDGRADPTQSDPATGSFPLLAATSQKHKGCVRLLLDLRADPQQKVQADVQFPILTCMKTHQAMVKTVLKGKR